MDNRQFNVKGRSELQLLKTLECLLTDDYDAIKKVWGWKFDETKGIVLYWLTSNDSTVNQFMGAASVKTLTTMIWDWLHSEEAKSFKITEDWDLDCDQDGSNYLGFRVYNDKWSCVELGGNINHYTIAAIAPAWCWYGK